MFEIKIIIFKNNKLSDNCSKLSDNFSKLSDNFSKFFNFIMFSICLNICNIKSYSSLVIKLSDFEISYLF